MPLYAIRSNERLAYVVDDATIYYRRLTYLEWRAAQQRFTVNGVTDTDALMLDCVSTCVVGWDNYRDPVTEAVLDYEHLNPEERRQEILALPPTVQGEVYTRMHQALVQREIALGNSSAGSQPPTP